MADLQEEIIKLTKEFLGAIDRKDYNAYSDKLASNVSCFEPCTEGHLAEGLDFQKFYFGKTPTENCAVTIVNPRVHVIGPDAACIAYVRLRQRMTESGSAVTHRTQETRVWQKIDGKWKIVHFHNSIM
ncbi:calcium/calmodulin-dependent protein kinase type II alpha chain-like [Ptychodera flava]|uniref:calcium/calmodulin-dependent protein kinase type II alpha chain-like n=1 Tax=Ptychodera flava TaxID=63121 RepID=UPI003969CF3D